MFINPKRTIPAHISNLTHITQNDVDPVSYTHLDVYKRQVVCKLFKMDFVNTVAPDLNKLSITRLTLDWFPGIGLLENTIVSPGFK